jgi:radical SAM superfamily enzyme YgiQ (UPF0313 family)
MKILLIFPSRLDSTGQVKKYKKVLFMPLSLAILDGLTPDRHQVSIVNDIAEPIGFDEPYDLVGITVMTSQAGRAYAIADQFRTKGIRVVLGGYHPTLMPDDASPHADALVLGEAEEVWEDLLADCENNRLKSIYQAPELSDLSRPCFPRWDNFNLDTYVRPLRAKTPEVPIFATRGCPFNCSFCTVTHFFKRTFRTRPIANVLAEIDASPSDQFFLTDDNIIGKPEYAREFFKGLQPKQVRWYTQLSSNIVHQPDLIDLAGRAGCHSAFIGIESINQESLKSANKQFNNIAMYEELFGRLRAAGITPFVGIIFGFDYDTPDIFERTLDFLRKNKISMASFQILTPFPGTRFYDDMEEQGLILDKNWSLYDGSHMVFRHRTFSQLQLLDGYWQAFGQFHSLANITRRLSHPPRLDKNPLVSLAVNLLFLLHNRRLIRSRQHPMAGGVTRIK